MAAAALAVGGAAGPGGAASPHGSPSHRLISPFGGPDWPQQTHFVLDAANTTLKIARGDAFGLAVKVRPGDQVPDSARAIYRFADGSETRRAAAEPARAASSADGSRRSTSPSASAWSGAMTPRRSATSPVSVVPPPSLKSLTVRVVPPPYTGIATADARPRPHAAPRPGGNAARPGRRGHQAAEAAELRIGEEPAGAAVAFDASRTRFQASLPVKSTFNFWFRLKDTEGFLNREESRFDVRSYRDEAPRVVIDEPKTDRDVPAEATVPVRVLIDDDFGIHSARLIYKIATGESEPRDEVVIPLFAADDQSPAPAASSLVKHKEIAHTWELAPLKLAPGSIITFYADARDFDAIKGPNVGKSRELRLRIVSKEDAARQFDDARRELREELARVLTMQKQAMAPVDNAARTLSRTDRLPQPQRDDLNNASMIQRQVSSRFTSREEGLARADAPHARRPAQLQDGQPRRAETTGGHARPRGQRPRPQPRAGRAGDRPCRQGPGQPRDPAGRPAASPPSRQQDGDAQGKPESARNKSAASPDAEKKDAGGGQAKDAQSPPSSGSQTSQTSKQQKGQAAEKSAGGRPESAKEQAGGRPQGAEPKSQPGSESKPRVPTRLARRWPRRRRIRRRSPTSSRRCSTT